MGICIVDGVLDSEISIAFFRHLCQRSVKPKPTAVEAGCNTAPEILLNLADFDAISLGTRGHYTLTLPKSRFR